MKPWSPILPFVRISVSLPLLILIALGLWPSPNTAASNLTAPFSGVDLPVKPNHELALANCGLGRISLMEGELDEAIDNFSECIKYGPSLIDGYICRGKAYLEKANTLTKRSDQVALKRQALEDYGKAVSLGYNEPDIFRERGDIFAEIGETQLAIDELRQAAQMYKLKGLNSLHGFLFLGSQSPATPEVGEIMRCWQCECKLSAKLREARNIRLKHLLAKCLSPGSISISLRVMSPTAASAK